MTFNNFIRFPKTQQIDMISSGELLDVRIDGDLNILLYDMGGFYVELFHCPLTDRIITLIPFKETKHLEPYLNRLVLEVE